MIIGKKLTAREALLNAQSYALSRTWAIGEDDKQYLTDLRKEALG